VSDEIPPDRVLPCGCFIRALILDGVRTVTIAPCKVSCVNYRNTLSLAEAVHRSVTYEQAP